MVSCLLHLGVTPIVADWPEKTEAEHFASIAMDLGVPGGSIYLERKATNTGENIQFTQKQIRDEGLRVNSILLVQKPYMERRVFATFKKQWVGAIDFIVSSPPILYENYFDRNQPKNSIINIMVGNLQRIKEYPELGFQAEQKNPNNVWSAWQRLVAAGYTGHLISK